MADTGLLGSLMGGAANIGRSILNIPSQIGEQYKAGSLFGGGGALGDLLGEQARQEAQRQAIMKLGLGLLGQGPSRTPISFGQSLASGLLGAQEEYQKQITSGLQEELAAEKLTQARQKKEAMDTISDPEASEEDKLSAFRSAYPLEFYKLEYKKDDDLFGKIVDQAIRKKQLGLPLSEVEQDAYNKKMSSGDSLIEYLLGGDSSSQGGLSIQQQAQRELDRRRQGK